VGEPMLFAAIPQQTLADKPITYTWTFGDGASETNVDDATAEHTYAVGSYEVTLEVSNVCSPTAVITVTRDNQVTSGDPLPIISDYLVYLPIVLKGD